MEQFVELPQEVKTIIVLAITVLVTQGLKWIGDKFGIDLTGKSAEVTAALVGLVLTAINALLAQVPAEAAPLVNVAFQAALVIFGAYGAYKVFLKK